MEFSPICAQIGPCHFLNRLLWMARRKPGPCISSKNDLIEKKKKKNRKLGEQDLQELRVCKTKEWLPNIRALLKQLQYNTYNVQYDLSHAFEMCSALTRAWAPRTDWNVNPRSLQRLCMRVCVSALSVLFLFLFCLDHRSGFYIGFLLLS